MKIKKAIIAVAGLGTRFMPLSKVLPKELFPLVDKPVLQYILEEVYASGIKEVIFVNRPEKKIILDYFRKKIKSKKILNARYKNHFLKELKSLKNISKNISFSQVLQKKPLGDGHAILQAQKKVKTEPCAVLWADDIVESKTPCLLQLMKVFEKYQKPVIALCKIPKESIPFYGTVDAEPVANHIYKIKKIVEKPLLKKSPSNLAIVGKFILLPEVFNAIKKSCSGKKGEIILSEVLGEMIKNNKEIYGYEFEGKWLECGNKLAYLKSNFYLSLKHPQFGSKLKKYLKQCLKN